jgi:hypothetical protein
MMGKYRAVNTRGHKYYLIRPKLPQQQMTTQHLPIIQVHNIPCCAEPYLSCVRNLLNEVTFELHVCL